MHENRSKALGYVMACVVAWAFIPVVSRFGQTDLDNYQFLFWSSLFSLAALFISTIVSGKKAELMRYQGRALGAVLGLGFLGTFLYYLLLYFGYAHAPGLEVLVIQYTWPVFIVIFSFIFLKERATWRNLLAIVFGFLGVVLVLTKGDLSQIQLSNLNTDLIVLIAAGIFGLFSVLSKKAVLEPFSATTYFFVSATICSFVSMLLFSQFSFPTMQSAVPILVNGIIINGFSYILWLKGLSYARASFTAPFVFLTPVLAAILIVLFFHEPFLAIYAVGLGLVLIGGLVSR